MKRYGLIVLSIIMLCRLLLMPTALVNAYEAGYETTNHLATDEIVMDGAWSAGNWTYGSEWNDTAVPSNLPAGMHWRDKWTYPGGTDIIAHYLIEFFVDNTTDAGDYFEMCVDCQVDGGTAPQTDDIKIYYSGQDNGTLIVYQGTGSGWVEHPNYTIPDDVQVVNSINSSPLNATPHLIIELTYDRLKFEVTGNTYSPWIRIALYDESTATLAAWPPTSPDVPDDWGLETGSINPIPEALTIVAVVLLSSVAVAVSFYLLRKRPTSESHSAVKT